MAEKMNGLKFQSINMCDFCTKDEADCGSERHYSKDLGLETSKLESGDAVVACNSYESPVELLKKRFHDFT